MARLIDRLIPRGEDRQTVSAVGSLFDTEPERILTDFRTYAYEGYKGNGPLFSVIALKALAVSEVKWVWERDGEKAAGPKGLTPAVVAALEVDADLAGNAYVRKVGDRLYRLRPDWVDIVLGVPSDQAAAAAGQVDRVGYQYWPEGRNTGRPVLFDAREVGHYAPLPDPLSAFRGQSWIQAVAREGDSDNLMSRHKAKFFTNAATPNLVVTATQSLTAEQRELMKQSFQARYESWENAYKTLFLEGGATVEVVGSNMEQMTFAQVQAAGETRIAAAAGVPPVVVGFVQGIQAATYSNYSQAMRRFNDLTCRPRWRQMAHGLQHLFEAPDGFRLWYDDRDVGFLQQDAKDAAGILKEQALTVEALIRAGYTPDTARDAVVSGRLDGLQHSGLVSVQLLPPGETEGLEPDGDRTFVPSIWHIPKRDSTDDGES